MPASQKDYEKIASIFSAEVAMVASLSNSDIKKSAQYSLRNVVLSMADHFAQTNPRFNREKFYTACGMEFTPVSGWWPRESASSK